MDIKIIFSLLAIIFPLTAISQNINFETQNFKGLAIYDTWEESPFRTGVLKGNYAIVNNHLSTHNNSQKILALQRSRFGSNTFGIKIILNTSFELSTKIQYIHLKVHRPYEGRVMVIGLGKRRDRKGQSPDTEQFWAMSTHNISANRWEEVVLPIKGNGGIDIYSLVIVPDCESPHNYTEDKICYIDDIEINNHPEANLKYDCYTKHLNLETKNMTAKQNVMQINFKTCKDNLQCANTKQANYKKGFYLIDSDTFTANPGDPVSAGFIYNGNVTQGFLYADWDQNGEFEEKEMVSSTIRSNKDNPYFQDFKIPKQLQPGFYRLRYVIDQNIIDIRINIHNPFCHVNDANRNGEILTAEGLKLSKYAVPFGKPFTIRMKPESGFTYSGIVIKHGYNLSADSIQHGNKQWEKIFFGRELFNGKDEFTIPGKYLDGNIEIEGLFIEESRHKSDNYPNL